MRFVGSDSSQFEVSEREVRSQKRVMDQLSAALDERFWRQGILTFHRLAVHEVTGDFLS